MFKKTINRSLLRTILLLIISSSFPFISSMTYSQEEDYVANYGRVRYLESKVTIVRGADGLTEDITLNAPILPGDTITTSRDGKAELQLADSSLIRMNYATELKFQALTDLTNDYELSTILKLYNGSIYVQAEHMDDKEKNFQIDTPFASIYLLTDGLYRINVNSEQQVEVFCHRGVAEVVGEYDSVLLRSGKMTFVTHKSSPADPRGFNSFYSDSFDRWNDEQDEIYYQTNRVDEYYEDIPYEVRHYYTELSYYGNWVHVPVYGYVWYPYRIYAGWRPYYNGYWHYGPSGYFWVSYEPWGWAPYHYGRWSWASGYGWIWIPGRTFCGAWVSWSYGPSYIGWCALDYWNYPAYINASLYLGLYDFRSWNFVHYRDVSVRNVRHAVLRQNVVERELNESVVVRKQPRVGPHRLNRDPESRRKAWSTAKANKAERIRGYHQEKIPKNAASFRDAEKKETYRERSARTKALTNKKHASDLSRKSTRFDTGKDARSKRAIPGAKGERSSSRDSIKNQKMERIPPKGNNQREIKTFQRIPSDKSLRKKNSSQAKPSYKSQDRARESKIKSYSRKRTQENIQRSKPSSPQQKSYRSPQRNKRQSNYQNKNYNTPKPKSYDSKQRYDSSQKWKKMLKKMNQPRKTHEVKQKSHTKNQTIKKGTTSSKSGTRSSSSGKSKRSSSKSKSSGRKSRGR
jgi:hypothetical protein